jgi:hypothetical protein
VSREELRALFSTAGEVTKVDIPNGGRNLVGSCGLLPVGWRLGPAVGSCFALQLQFAAWVAHHHC